MEPQEQALALVEPQKLKLPDVTELLQRRGPFGCTKCGDEVEFPFCVCSECAAHGETLNLNGLLARARETIPSRFDWANVGSKRLREVVGAGPLSAATRFLKLPRLPIGLAIVGPLGTGKSSLGAAMLRQLHDAVTVDTPHAAVELARGAYFVAARDLTFIDEGRRRHLTGNDPEMERAIDALKLSTTARLLLLDNVTRGTQGDAVSRCVMERYDSDRPTIVTTFLTKQQAAECYGGDWADRVYQHVISTGGPA